MGERSYLIEKIQQLHKERKALNINAVKRHSPELLKIAYSQKQYWGWKQALADAGFSYSDIRIYLEDYTTCKICKKTFRSLMAHLSRKHEVSKIDYAEEFGDDIEVICEELRSNRLLRAAKNTHSELPHWEPLYSKEYLLDRLWAYHKMGKSLHARAVQKYDYALLTGTRKYFGGWHPALKAIGLDPDKIRKIDHIHWSQALIIKKLKKYKKNNLPLNPKNLRLADENLYLAIRRFFDNDYDAALIAADILPNEVRLNCRRSR
jgi:hypothetical protein